MFCFQCGKKVDYETDKFCTFCGVNLHPAADQYADTENNDAMAAATKEQSADERGTAADQQIKNISEQVKGTFVNATKRINAMVGEEGSIDLNLKDVFSSVMKKHTKEEAEQLFIAGTSMTTPNEEDIPTTWPKPWLFSRVFIVLVLTYILLFVSTYIFENLNALPGLIMIGSFAVPFSLLIFFWETNAPRNISIYETSKMLFVGGAASIVITLFLFEFFPVYDLSYVGAIIVGTVEEVGKLLIIAYFIKKLQVKYILNGLLIGAAIGGGFAAFESAGYAFVYGMAYGDQTMISLIFTRGWMAIGTHVVWAAIAGAALVYVNGDQPLKNDHFFNSKFLQLFSVPIILHAVWNMPITVLEHLYIKYIVLIVIAWIFIFTLMSAGLKQISRNVG